METLNIAGIAIDAVMSTGEKLAEAEQTKYDTTCIKLVKQCDSFSAIIQNYHSWIEDGYRGPGCAKSMVHDELEIAKRFTELVKSIVVKNEVGLTALNTLSNTLNSVRWKTTEFMEKLGAPVSLR